MFVGKMAPEQPPGHANSPERGHLWMPDTGVAKVGTGGDAICKILVFFRQHPGQPKMGSV